MKRLALLLSLAGCLSGAVVVDRIAVIVNKKVIKSSDIDRDLRLTQFLNTEPRNSRPESSRKAAARLIDQSILREEIATANFRWATRAEADALLSRIRQDRFGGSSGRLQMALSQYSLSEEELRSHLTWQLTVLRYIDQRFRDGAVVTDEEIRAYYEQHLAELKRENPRDSSFETLAPKIRESLEGERVNQNFVESMDQARKQNRIQYLAGAFE